MARNSNPLFFPMVVVGGAMGCLAAYGALRLMQDHGVTQSPQQQAAIPPAKPQIASQPTKQAASEPARSTPPKRVMPRPDLSPPRVEPIEPAQQPNKIVRIGRKDAAIEIPEETISVEPPPPDVRQQTAALALPEPSVKITLTLDKPAMRAVADVESPDGIVCDVGFSRSLMDSTFDGEFAIVASALSTRDKKTVELPLKLDAAGAAIEITTKAYSKTVVCELRPQFSLPGLGVEPLTQKRLGEVAKMIDGAIEDGKNYSKIHSALTRELSDLESNLSAARAAVDNAANITEQNLATRRVRTLENNIRKQQAAVDRSERIPEAARVAADEQRLFAPIAEYAKQIDGQATIYVRFYRGDVTLPATSR